MKLIYFILLFLSSFYAASKSPKKTGARVGGLGEITTNLNDGYSLFFNPAEITHQHQAILVSSYENRFFIPELSTTSIGTILPLKKHMAAGIGFLRFGGDLYHEQLMSFSFGHEIDKTGIGLRADIFQSQAIDQHPFYTIFLNVGGITQVHPHVSCSAYISQLSPSLFTKQNQGDYTTSMVLGIAYKPYASILILTELEKQIQHPSTFRVATEYNPVSYFFIRLGMCQSPFYFSGGCGIHGKHLAIDISSIYHFSSSLGFVHQLSLIYQWKK